MDVFFFKININPKVAKLTGKDERIHSVPTEPGYALSPYTIYLTTAAVLEQSHKALTVCGSRSGDSRVTIYTDKGVLMKR